MAALRISVFPFFLYLYYYNARKKNNPTPKGEHSMKTFEKIEKFLDDYYGTFKR